MSGSDRREAPSSTADSLAALPLPRDENDEGAWEAWGRLWRFPAGVTYLNHGSFGPPPRTVRESKARWQELHDDEPMEFFVRRLEPAWHAARVELARFLNARPDDLVLTENATGAMNEVACNFRLAPTDRVLLTDHEYGAVHRIWQRACTRADAESPDIVTLPWPPIDTGDLVQAVLDALRPETTLVVLSHITSPTALLLPVAELCREIRARGVAVCVDGPHALVQVPLDLRQLDADFYTASCHKWLSAPFGTGFLWVHPRHQEGWQPTRMGWGRLPPGERATWSDEYIWSGTRDPTSWLSLPAAVAWIERLGVDRFRARTRALTGDAREQWEAMTGLRCPVPAGPDWDLSMVHLPLPDSTPNTLQQTLLERFGVEVPVVTFRGESALRISCHVYNHSGQVDRLIHAMQSLGVG